MTLTRFTAVEKFIFENIVCCQVLIFLHSTQHYIDFYIISPSTEKGTTRKKKQSENQVECTAYLGKC